MKWNCTFCACCILLVVKGEYYNTINNIMSVIEGSGLICIYKGCLKTFQTQSKLKIYLKEHVIFWNWKQIIHLRNREVVKRVLFLVAISHKSQPYVCHLRKYQLGTQVNYQILGEHLRSVQWMAAYISLLALWNIWGLTGSPEKLLLTHCLPNAITQHIYSRPYT